MKTQQSKTERIHSLDSLRAIMMLLGLVLHSAITYGVIDYGAGWSLKDSGATHLSNDFIFGFIQSMPLECKYSLLWPAFLEPCYFTKENL